MTEVSHPAALQPSAPTISPKRERPLVNIVQEAHDITDVKTDIWDVEKHDLLHGHEPSSKQVKKKKAQLEHV